MWLKGEEEEDDEEELEVSPLILGSCIFGILTLLVMVTVAFEAMQDYLVHTISSKHMRPMMASLFGEMTILGFLSVVTFTISQAGLLRHISIKIFGDSEEGRIYLTELFEQVHYLLFAIMVLFIVKVLILLHLANLTIAKWRIANREAQNPDSVNRIAEKYLAKEEKKWKCTFTQTESYQFFRFLSLRKEFIENRNPFAPFDKAPADKQLPVHFDYAEYLSVSLGRFLAEVIYMPPVTWIALWLVCGLFFVTYIVMAGNIELFATAVAVFGLLNLLAIIEVQKKCNWIMDMLLNPSDFPRGHITFKASVKGVLAARKWRGSKDASLAEQSEQDSLMEPLRPSTQITFPAWTDSSVRRPSRWVSKLFGDDVAPNRHSSLFWFGRPELNLFLLRLHLVVRAVYIALLLAVILPDLWVHSGHLAAVLVGVFSLSFVVWEYVFVLGDLITTMCHVSSCGMLRHLPTQEEIIRKQQTRRTFRAIMMMASLVQAMRAERLDSLDKETSGPAGEEPHVSQAEANDIGSIFDMYDADGSGEIDRDELWKVMESLGFVVSEDELDTMFALLDTDHNGVISRMEFIRWHLMSKDKKKSDMKELARYMFQTFDADHSGTIKVSELVDGLKGLKHGLSTDDIVALANELDENSDGEISLQEFEAIIKC